MKRIQDIDLKLLRTFKAIVEAGGVSAAQVALNTSQSTLSTQLVELEARLGFTLCRRGRGGFALTSEGEKLLEALDNLIAATERFQNAVADISGEMRGILRIGVMDAMLSNTAWPLHEVIEKFSNAARETVVDLTLVAPASMEAALVEGRRDVVIGPFSQKNASLGYIPLYQERHSLYASKHHPLAQLAEVTFDDLRKHGLVATPSELQRLPYIRKQSGRGGRQLAVAATVDQMESHAILIKSGRYVGFMPEHVVQSSDGFVKLRAGDELQYYSPIYLAHRKDAELNLMLRSFLNRVREQRLVAGPLTDMGAVTELAE